MLAAFSALLVELAIWFVPQLLRARREPAYSMQFCFVLDIDINTARITVSFMLLDAVPLEVILIKTNIAPLSAVPCAHISLNWLLVQVAYQHSPGGIDQLYSFPGQPPDHQGTLSQRQAYTEQYQVGLFCVSHISPY